MILNPIDDANDLFEVKNVVSQETMEELNKLDLLSLPRVSNCPGQDDMSRVSLDSGHPVFEQIIKETNTHCDLISKAIGREVKGLTSRFWVDTEGFTIYPHVDASGVDVAFQLYLKDLPHAGTRFFIPDPSDMFEKNDNQRWHWLPVGGWNIDYPMLPMRSTPRKEFRCVANTGYLMINHPAQLHSVPITLKKGELRLSAYFHLIF